MKSMKSKRHQNNNLGLAVIVFRSEISGKTVGSFVGIDNMAPDKIILKADHALSILPTDTTMHIYDFEKANWDILQGSIISCRQSDNPGNFILTVESREENLEKEMFLEDSRIIQIMERMEFFMSLKFFQLLPHNTIWAVLSRLAPVSYHEGDKIMTQGIRGDGIYFIEQEGCYHNSRQG